MQFEELKQKVTDYINDNKHNLTHGIEWNYIYAKCEEAVDIALKDKSINDKLDWLDYDIAKRQKELEASLDDCKELRWIDETNLTSLIFQLVRLEADISKQKSLTQEPNAIKLIKNLFGDFETTYSKMDGVNNTILNKTSAKLECEKNTRLAILNELYSRGNLNMHQFANAVISIMKVYQNAISAQQAREVMAEKMQTEQYDEYISKSNLNIKSIIHKMLHKKGQEVCNDEKIDSGLYIDLCARSALRNARNIIKFFHLELDDSFDFDVADINKDINTINDRHSVKDMDYIHFSLKHYNVLHNAIARENDRVANTINGDVFGDIYINNNTFTCERIKSRDELNAEYKAIREIMRNNYDCEMKVTLLKGKKGNTKEVYEFKNTSHQDAYNYLEDYYKDLAIRLNAMSADAEKLKCACDKLSVAQIRYR